jgi:hypothetical protein
MLRIDWIKPHVADQETKALNDLDEKFSCGGHHSTRQLITGFIGKFD